ncbi:MAG TPA: hypothetical protein VGM29_00575 [Polyangiaceae bacterium]
MSRARSRELRRIQRELERFYGLERAPDVTRFVREGESGSREVVLVRELDAELEIGLVLPPESRSLAATPFGDLWLQAVEGVSHFLYLVERARVSLPTTRLELELQAEVDKFVVVSRRVVGRVEARVRRLFEDIRFTHAVGSEDGERYRLANSLAARFVMRTVAERDLDVVQGRLRRFYRAGQTEKISLARAA